MPEPMNDPSASEGLSQENNRTPEALIYFDRLQVGPVQLEPRKLSAVYRLERGDDVWEMPLEYAYEEDVFTPPDENTLNLAGMVAAQVALNYGLFCRSIVFHGLFDAEDRRFLRAMAENTAREIYVKKFLEPNPFLVGIGSEIGVQKRKTYCTAKISFVDIPAKARRRDWTYWDSDRNKHAILSSGGKDSLLTFGLLNEINRETHPIFINESGRHWFTALNAYRHFKVNVPNTARVWVNSDRIFNWVVRLLPFIRDDFQDVRSDEYPIRLWTVAVFLFGALPILRRRKIGRLLIGDEFDTTRRCTHEGIFHYDGLYDQSRYFDDALSRYFLRRGWAISQFSVLRPLSELIIQKILAKRYPDLQKFQVSCHAAHQKDQRVFPCGRCEKCRRIVGMLTAVDEDPGRCGYTAAQVENCLKGLLDHNLHQEQEGATHLLSMLVRSGAIQWPEERRAELKEHPEVLHLRFDSEASPVDGIPVDLRPPLYGIYKECTEGALQKKGSRWIPFDVLSDERMAAPYVFEPLSKTASAGEMPAEGSGKGYLWAQMTSPEARERLEKVDIALLPVGSIEQHGPHLTLDVDAFDADCLARRVASACSDPKPLVLPLIPYGVSYHHDEFPGTISITNHTLAQVIYEIGVSVARNGIRKLVIVNGHGDNAPTLNYAAQMIIRDMRIFCCVDTGETSDVDLIRLAETPNDVHAGEIETSTSLATRPELVQMEKAQRSVPEFSSRYLNFSTKRSLPWYAYTKRISESGVMGDPTRATVEKGRKMWEIMVAHLLAFVEDLKNLSLEEIYQKKY